MSYRMKPPGFSTDAYFFLSEDQFILKDASLSSYTDES